MKADIEIISTELLKPSSPTPDHQKSIQRSMLDQYAGEYYVPVILFYTNGAEHSINIPKTLLHLKKSLSDTLTRFYPYAGRIKDLVSIDCNDQGVIYTEARVHCQIIEFLQKPDIDLLCKFLPCKPWALPDTMISSLPLFGIQVNVFECGGIVIGSCFSHMVADAATISVFLNSWARATRGCTEEEAMPSPDFSLAPSLFPPRAQLLNGMSHPYPTQQRKFVTRRFLFSTESLGRLREEVATNTNPNPSRVQSITAFMWVRYLSIKCILTGAPSTNVSGIFHAVNLRPRVDPPLPSCSVGNLGVAAVAFYDPQTTSKEGLQEGQLLQKLAMKVKNAFESVDSNSIDSLKREEGYELVKTWLDVADKAANNIGIIWSSWCKMGFYEVDFGWGKPVWVGGVGKVEEPTMKKWASILLYDSGPADSDPGIEMWITLPEEEMAILENDHKFLKFASANPSIFS